MKLDRRKRILIAALIFPWLFLSISAEAKRSRRSDPVGCRAVIFSDSTKVKRLYGKNVHTRVKPASTTKVMTALLVLEHLSLDRHVTVTSRATLVQPSKIHVRPGERYTVRDLLYAILLSSANDASIVLAEAVAGSEKKFVDMMNQKAKSLGAKNTRFANSNGLPSQRSQYTTAYDMYLIFREALTHDFFRSAIRYSYKTIYSARGRQIGLKSHNKMLFMGWRHKIYGKTGYTRAAQACFVGTLDKGGSTLIIGVFGCSRRWETIKHVVSRYGGVAL